MDISLLFVVGVLVSSAMSATTKRPRSFLATPRRQGVPAFSLNLYRQISLSTGPQRNIAISPLSAESALTTAVLSVAGRTGIEIDAVLSTASMSVERYHAKIRAIRDSSSEDGFTILSTSGMYLDQTYVPVQEDPDDDTGNSQNINLDFTHDPEASRWRINDFIARKTNNRIRELLQAESVGADTRVVLVNVLFFKANWEKQFDKEATESQPFTLPNGQKISVPMMYQKGEFAYSKSRELNGAQLLQLPYKNKAASMIVVLPAQGSTLKALEASLTPEALNTALANMRLQKVHVSLPKFKFEATNSLVAALKALGMKAAFTQEADFSPLSPLRAGLQISQVVQKVFIGTKSCVFKC